MHEASSVTKDFLLLSQPFINQGSLIASAKSGRRLYIHHLSEVPLGEVFLTRNGNHLQRTEPKSATLSGTITLAVEDIPPLPVASVQMTQAIPTKVFSGPISVRDAAVLKLLQQGKQANGGGDFSAACACFEAAYALSVRAGMLVSAANMRLKLSQPATAAAMYRSALNYYCGPTSPGCSPTPPPPFVFLYVLNYTSPLPRLVSHNALTPIALCRKQVPC